MLNTNIKARRLGYTVALIKILRSNFLFLDDLSLKLERWGKENQRFLKRYIDNSGEISSSPKHYPARRYIELAKELGLIQLVGGESRVTKLGQPLLFFNQNENKPFELELEQICYLTKRLLIMDFDYLLPLLRIIEKYHEPPLMFAEFRKTALKHLNERKGVLKDIISSYKFRKRIETISSWEKERKYLEHIIYPRINWLIDLRIIDWEIFKEKHVYELSSYGTSLFGTIHEFKGDEQLVRWCNSTYYENFFDSHYTNIASRKLFFQDFSENRKYIYIQDMLRESFRNFSSIGPPIPHLSATTFLEYCCAKSLSKGIIVTFEELVELLGKIPGYRFEWEAPVHDGFIVKITE